MPVRRLIAWALGVGVFLVGAGSAHAAPRLHTCAGQADFGCGTLRVPLDRGGKVAGTVGIRFAVQRQFPGGPRRVLIALAGGPGQPAVELAGSFAISLDPALRHYRLAVLDQRGTGGSGLLTCPNVQRLRALDPFTPAALASCAQLLGPRRAFYSTADSVLDIEALRKALGASKVALMGVSYGTYVALQYARAFPHRVDRLILDSIVGPGQPDGFQLDIFGAVPRILRDTCAHNACRGITADPVRDLGAVVAALQTAPLRGAVFDTRGRRHAAVLSQGEQLLAVLEAGDLNPFLQAALPAALAGAGNGDPALLVRLLRPATGEPTSAREISFGVLAATGCEDAQLPYSLQSPLAERAGRSEAALGAIPPSRYLPFDAQTVLRASAAEDCGQWPAQAVRQPFTGPLPNVPALLLSGRADVRTPLENALATAAQLPRATIVALRGSGHDVIDTDITGCSGIALDRFISGRRVGKPCLGRDVGVDSLPLPPRKLEDFRVAPGVSGRRGRAVFAALETVADAHVAALISLYGGFSPRGGGLHGGRFEETSTFDGTLVLDRYAYLLGLRLTGTVHTTDGRARGGSVHVQGLGLDGTLSFGARGSVVGVLGGQRVSYVPRSARASTATRVGAPSIPHWTGRAPPPRSPLGVAARGPR